ncbi:MAG TPA: xylulokinase [Phycisphaerae bacterium]|nr:xylulokinase [Phycisphaerae bacterium]HRY67649.1 xylulokinase [Phycisphaerae bacterium]HSA25036.1 xylulokinase [Phycisphaerae bacterium]
MALLCGIDIGTSATKALLCTAAGRVLATASVEYPVYAPRPGWSEQEPEDWWRACIKGIAEICRRARRKPSDITAIGLSGQMHGSVFVDKVGKPLRRALLWNDQRTARECAQIEQLAGGRKKLISMVSNVALTGFTAPKILWVRRNDPRVYAKTYKVLLPKDYIRLCLTGEYASEVSDAAGTLLLEVKKRAWHKGLLSRLSIDSDLMPPVHESTEISGRISGAAAKLTGLKVGTPVVGGAGDQPAGAVGNGIVRAGIVSATMGTSGVVFAHADAPVPNERGNLQSFCHAVPGKWCVFGCMLSAGGSLQWLRDTLWADEVKALRSRKKDPGQLYPMMIEEAASVAPGCEGLVFLPYLTGERCPYPDPTARGAWVGLTVRHRRGHMIRAVLEGITFGMRDQVELMRAGGVQISEVRASGGGAANECWRQLQADMYDADVVTINTREGGALGVALLAAVGTGVYASVPEACSAVIKVTTRLSPNKGAQRAYGAVYPVYQSLYQSLRREFAALSEV